MITLSFFMVTLLLGVPIFIVLLAAVFIFLQDAELSVLFSSLPSQLYGALDKNSLLAVPLFILVGELMNRGGLTSRLMQAADVFVGGFRGGLAYVNLLTNAMAASILGSATAQISVMSRLMIPTMTDKGYPKPFSSAVTLAGGLLGPIIPPSMLMIIYGVVAYQSISELFVAGILPGLLIIGAFALLIFITGIVKGLPKGEHLRHQNWLKELVNGILPGSIPLIVIVCILLGMTTPTEAAALASIVAFMIGAFIYRSIKLGDILGIFANVGFSTAVITGLIASASIFGWALSFESIPDMLVSAITGITTSPFVFIMIVYAIIVVLGMFLESISVMIVLVPIILPAAVEMGYDPIHFGIMISLATVVGIVTPPVGSGLFIAMEATGLGVGTLFKAIIPFLFMMMICMVIIALVPQISLWLPSLIH